MHKAADTWAENLLQAIADEVDVVSENVRSASAKVLSPHTDDAEGRVLK
jgi:hypothetical protein